MEARRAGCFSSMQKKGWKRKVFSNPKKKQCDSAAEKGLEPIVQEKSTIPQQLWLSFIKDEIDVTNPIQTKAELSYATAGMDKIGGWHEGRENWT